MGNQNKILLLSFILFLVFSSNVGHSSFVARNLAQAQSSSAESGKAVLDRTSLVGLGVSGSHQTESNVQIPNENGCSYYPKFGNVLDMCATHLRPLLFSKYCHNDPHASFTYENFADTVITLNIGPSFFHECNCHTSAGIVTDYKACILRGVNNALGKCPTDIYPCFWLQFPQCPGPLLSTLSPSFGDVNLANCS